MTEQAMIDQLWTERDDARAEAARLRLYKTAWETLYAYENAARDDRNGWYVVGPLWEKHMAAVDALRKAGEVTR